MENGDGDLCFGIQRKSHSNQSDLTPERAAQSIPLCFPQLSSGSALNYLSVFFSFFFSFLFPTIHRGTETELAP